MEASGVKRQHTEGEGAIDMGEGGPSNASKRQRVDGDDDDAFWFAAATQCDAAQASAPAQSRPLMARMVSNPLTSGSAQDSDDRAGPDFVPASSLPDAAPSSPLPTRRSGPPVLFSAGPPRTPTSTGAPTSASRPRPPMLASAGPLQAAAAPFSPRNTAPSRPNQGARPGHETEREGVMCKCSEGTRKAHSAVTGGAGPNAGRRYYRCVQRNQTGGCDFWLWHDDGPKGSSGGGRDARAPNYREIVHHNLLYATGGRTAERLVVLTRAARAQAASSAPRDDAKAEETAKAWVTAVGERWNVTQTAPTDPSESVAEGAARLMPLVDIDRPMGATAQSLCHPHAARTVACTALLAHMFAVRGWHVVVQPPAMAFYQHVHLYVSRGPYDAVSHWVRVEPAQRIDPRAPPDVPVQFDALWVQMRGPDPDSVGWLTGSHVDLVAFEADEGFLLADRRSLWRYVDRYVVARARAAGQTTQGSRVDATTPTIADLPTVREPAQADHRILDMGAAGHSPHERRTLIAVEALRQHDATHGDEAVVQDVWPFDDATAAPYLERMGRVRRDQSAVASADPAHGTQ